MTKPLILAALIALAAPVDAKPVDLTGMSCSRLTNFGKQTWEFYGDVAIRYFDDGTVDRLTRIGEGAYEKYDRDGKWTAAYLFYDLGDGIRYRILAKPGKITLMENPTAPMEKGVYPFNGTCASLWE